MNSSTLRTLQRCTLPALLALLMTGCSSDRSRCYAEAVPTRGEGGLAWGANLKTAQNNSMSNCATYASRSGGTPGTCKVVLAKCK